MTSLQIIQITMEACGAFFAFITSFAFLFGQKVSPRLSRKLALLLITDAILLVSDCFAYAFRGDPTTLGFFAVRISNFLVFLLIPILIIEFVSLICEIIGLTVRAINRVWLFIFSAVCGLHIVLLIVSQFTGLLYIFDAQNLYHRAPGFFLATVLGILELLLVAVFTIAHRKQLTRIQRYIVLVYLLLPLISSLIQQKMYGLSLNNIAATVSLMLLAVTVTIYTARNLYDERGRLYEAEMENQRQKLALAEKERELTDARLQLSLSMMQPHFMFNALGSIEQLCRVDADKAVHATHNFSRYLRNTLHAINLTDVHTFSNELEYVRNYVWLEKMRFGDDLSFTEDLNTGDFRVPVLTIQPLIQYLIQRGLMSVDDGILNFVIHTEENDERYLISIRADATGTLDDPSEEEFFHRSVLFNIKERLSSMCGGTLVQEIHPGKDCIFSISIPKNQDAEN